MEQSSTSGFPSAIPSTTTQASVPSTVPTTSTLYPQPSETTIPASVASHFDAIFSDPPRRHEAPNQRRDFPRVSQSAPNLQKDKDALFKPKDPPPKREVEGSHHHHHHINVDSETDFEKLHIDEKKVNYLPYNPPVAVSQTGLIQSIGRPFNPNHAKRLPDPGDEFKLTRRVSQVRLDQVKVLGDVNPKVVDGVASCIRLFSVLIGVAGLILFCFVLAISSGATPLEYALYFLDDNPVCKVVHIVGVVQPMAVAPYCRYALMNLKHVRTYFLRVPILLVFPLGVTLCGLAQFTGVVTKEGDMKRFLRARMKHYYLDTYITTYAEATWDGIQDAFSCCGMNSPKDWDRYNTTHYPQTCCKKEVPNCLASSTDLKGKGCESAYKNSNIPIALFYFAMGIVIIALEVFSVVFMRSLHFQISDELYDERSSLTIMCGKICSLCDLEDTDEELEYDEAVEHVPARPSASEGGKGDTEAPSKPGKTTPLKEKAPNATATSDPSTASVKKSPASGVGRGRGRGRGVAVNKVAPAP